MGAAGAPSFGEKPIRERGQNLGAPRCPLWPGPKGLENLAQVCVGGGFGPKGLGISAQALAWVTLFLRASPVRAPDNAGAIHIDRIQIQMTISCAPSGLVAFIVRHPG